MSKMTAATTAALLRLNLRQVSAHDEERASALSPLPSIASGSKGASETKRSSSASGRSDLAFADTSFIAHPSCGSPGEADARIEHCKGEIGDQHAHDRQHRDEHQDETGEVLILHAQRLQQDRPNRRQV